MVTTAPGTHEEPESNDGSARLQTLQRQLNEAFLHVNHGEYIRSRVHGWVAYVNDVEAELPRGVSERLGTRFSFDRSADSYDAAAVDAFVIAYHAAETFWRFLFALLDGSGPNGAPLIAMSGLQTNRTFNRRVSAFKELERKKIEKLVRYLFTPPQVESAWSGEPALSDVHEYLIAWWRHLATFVTNWRNAYNAAKHGLAATVQPTQLSFVSSDGQPTAVDLMNGPVMRTLEHESVVAPDGTKIKDRATGQTQLRWFWVHRAIEPDELIAQAIVTADLLDALRKVARVRLLGGRGAWIQFRDAPLPRSMRRRATLGEVLRMPVTAHALPPDEAARFSAFLLNRGDSDAGPE